MRNTLLPYARQSIDDGDVAAVIEALRGDYLTTGPKLQEFESALAGVAATSQAVAVSSGTAALHAAMFALGIGSGDEVVVPAMTFAATANCVVFQGGNPVFADVDPESLLLDPAEVEARLTPRTKAVIAVDYAGQPCDYQRLNEIAAAGSLDLVADACHALGGSYRGRPVGSLAALSTFSFHPVKHMTTGEGGAVTTDDADRAERMRRFRNHGITADHHQREARGCWSYEMTELGYNYRITDLQCALGLSQLARLPDWLKRRRAIAARYDEAFRELAEVTPLAARSDVSHAYHLYVIRLELERLRVGRAEVFAALRAEGIGVNVHYLPVHLHPYYRDRWGTGPGLCPVAEAAHQRILSLPMFPAMTDADAADVIRAVEKVVATCRR